MSFSPRRSFRLAFTTTLLAGAALAQTERVSISTQGVQCFLDSRYPAISADGRFIVFSSLEFTLVPGDTNGWDDVFVRDRQLDVTVRASLSTTGAQGNGPSLGHAISANGRFVAFYSQATNLVPGDTNDRLDVFVRDLQLGTTERVSVGASGVQGDGDSRTPSISDDGLYVAFVSRARNLVTPDTNFAEDVFVHDRSTGVTELASVAAGSGYPNDNSAYARISGDARYVAFASYASDIVVPDTNQLPDVFRRDRLTGTTTRVSIAPGGAEPDGNSWWPSISRDGRYVAFESRASNLSPSLPTATQWNVYVADLQADTLRLASISASGAGANGASGVPAISADGRHVAFLSAGSNLDPRDTNAFKDIFVHDLLGGSTVCISLGLGNLPSNGDSLLVAISADARIVAFDSVARNLIVGDSNLVYDVFAHDRGTAVPPTRFCSGDGSATACPCGNAGAVGHGCASSTHAIGAVLTGTGTASLSADTFVLRGGGMPDSFALFVQGDVRLNGGLGTVFGDGLRCVGGSIVRLGRHAVTAGMSSYPIGSEYPISVRGGITVPGTRTYQVWYRNAASFCTTLPYNLSNGLEVTWTL